MEAFAQGVEGAGTDISKHDTQGGKGGGNKWRMRFFTV
jgi:hypothetical protein